MFVCDDCGSDEILKKVWHDVNLDVHDSDVEPEEYFCKSCEEPTKVSDVNPKHWEFVNSLTKEQIIEDLESIGVVTYDYEAEEIDCKISYCDSIRAKDLHMY